jgi:hypothetical protein
VRKPKIYKKGEEDFMKILQLYETLERKLKPEEDVLDDEEEIDYDIMDITDKEHPCYNTSLIERDQCVTLNDDCDTPQSSRNQRKTFKLSAIVLSDLSFLQKFATELLHGMYVKAHQNHVGPTSKIQRCVLFSLIPVAARGTSSFPKRLACGNVEVSSQT